MSRGEERAILYVDSRTKRIPEPHYATLLHEGGEFKGWQIWGRGAGPTYADLAKNTDSSFDGMLTMALQVYPASGYYREQISAKYNVLAATGPVVTSVHMAALKSNRFRGSGDSAHRVYRDLYLEMVYRRHGI